MERVPPSLADSSEKRCATWDKLQTPGLQAVHMFLLGTFVGKLINQLEI